MMKRFIILAGLVTSMTGFTMELKPLMIGHSVPSVPLFTAEGKTFDLAAASRKQPLAIIFYRGGWCPYCNRQLGQLQEIDPQLRKLGYRIIAISPDRPEKTAEHLEGSRMTYTLLSDSSMEAAMAFGIAFEVEAPMLDKLASYNIDIEEASGQTHHLLPVPAVFLSGGDGIIDFVYANPDYKIRLDPDVLLAAAKAATRADAKE